MLLSHLLQPTTNQNHVQEYEPFLAFFDEEGKYLQNVRTMSGGPSSTPVTGKTSSPDNSNPASKNSTNAGPTGQNLQPKPGNQSVEDGFSLQEKPLFEVVALYDYEKQDESEISFKKSMWSLFFCFQCFFTDFLVFDEKKRSKNCCCSKGFFRMVVRIC